ncbi:MAG: RNA methyltransferase [Bacteroidaceae bacterium]|nr:RNA methyltransferase [Bacteroidaceae bacterium]
MEIISSAQNPRIKKLLLLQQKSSARRKEGLFVVEGQRELMHCLNAGYEVDTIFYCPEIALAGNTEQLHRSNSDVEVEPLLQHAQLVLQITSAIYDKVAFRGGTEGIIATVKSKVTTLDDLHKQLATRHVDAPLFVVLESVEKPGNLGAILRSADASGADAVIVCDPLTDVFNPNLIRSSIGAIFTVPCVTCTSEECIAYLKKNKVQILTAQLQDSSLYYDTDMNVGTAIVMGTEATGLTQQWRNAADAHIRIPMLGKLDSLNVSVSAAILLYEAVRQRENHGKTSEKC